MSKTDIEEIVKAPSSHYASPQAVVDDNSLERDQKVRILQAWRADADALQRAESEAMDGGERPHVQDVEDALIALDAEDEVHSHDNI